MGSGGLNLSLPGGNPEFVPVEEDPGFEAEKVVEVVHTKVVSVPKESLSFKWTELGYGAMTLKVIVPSLAKHALFDHRNPGEEGPCLRSFKLHRPGINDVELPKATQDLDVQIKISNRYRMDRERNLPGEHDRRGDHTY